MDVRDYIQQHAGDFVADLKQWLAIPSISADPGHHGDVGPAPSGSPPTCVPPGSPRWRSGRREAQARPGLPAVFAEWPAADPAAPISLSTATTTCSRSSRLNCGTALRSSPRCATAAVARGATDDKGQVLSMSRGPGEPRTTGPSGPPVHIKMLVEGEEESGSPHFAALLRARGRPAGVRHGRGDGHRMWPRMFRPCAWDAGIVGRRRRARPGGRPALRLVRRRRTEPAHAWPASWPACMTRTGGSPCRASTTACEPSRPRSAR